VHGVLVQMLGCEEAFAVLKLSLFISIKTLRWSCAGTFHRFRPELQSCMKGRIHEIIQRIKYSSFRNQVLL